MSQTIKPGSLSAMVSGQKPSEEKQDNLGSGTTDAADNTQTDNEKKGQKHYRLPCAPCSISFPWGAKQVYESVYSTSDPDEIAELDKIVKTGGITYASKDDVYAQQQAFKPVQKILDENRGIIS